MMARARFAAGRCGCICARDFENRIEWVDIAQPQFDAASFGLDAGRVQQVMHARTPDGRVFTEVAAFVKIWETLPPRVVTTLLRWILKVPGTMWTAGIFYRLFARNRYRLTGRCTPENCPVPDLDNRNSKSGD